MGRHSCCYKQKLRKGLWSPEEDEKLLRHITKYHYKISQFYRRKNSVGLWLEVRRWFFYRRHHRRNTSAGFTFVGDSPFRRYISRKNKKKHLPTVLQTERARQKKNIPAWNIPTDFHSVSEVTITDGKYPSLNRSVNVWNTDGIFPSVTSSVMVEATVKWRRNNSIGNSVGESLKYRPNSSVGEILGNSFFLNLFLKNYLGYII